MARGLSKVRYANSRAGWRSAGASLMLAGCSFITVVDVVAVEIADHACVVQEGCACPGGTGRPFSFSMGASLTS